jgi:serine/threonine protein kinase
MLLVSGTKLGPYEISGPLGAGGMGEVYRALDTRHDRAVAVKVLRQDVSTLVGAERLLREIRIAAQLTHPHILPLIDSGEAGGVLESLFIQRVTILMSGLRDNRYTEVRYRLRSKAVEPRKSGEIEV